MALVSLRQLLDHAAEHGYGVPAFNVNNLEQIQAIMEAAQETQSPVILQASAGASKYAGEPYLPSSRASSIRARHCWPPRRRRAASSGRVSSSSVAPGRPHASSRCRSRRWCNGISDAPDR